MFDFCFSGSGELEFEEFCILAARFLIEEDEEQMRKELKEAFRFYDREGEKIHMDCDLLIFQDKYFLISGLGYLTIETLKVSC